VARGVPQRRVSRITEPANVVAMRDALAGVEGVIMMRPTADNLTIYFCRTPIDFRKAMDGLAAFVQTVMKHDPFDQSLYVFISKRRNKIKILYYERCGFVLWYKRLEEDQFHWPKSEADVITLSTQQLNWLLDGFNINAMTPHTDKRYSYAA
jgi:transposase